LEKGFKIVAKLYEITSTGDKPVVDSRTDAEGRIELKVDGDDINANMKDCGTEFKLKKNEYLLLEGVPVTMIYKVEEVVDDGTVNASGKSLIEEQYTTSYEYVEQGTFASTTKTDEEKNNTNVKQGTINTSRNTLTFTNKRTVETPNTGINLDFAPYVLIVLIAVCGGIVFVARKRRVDR
jgi:hypothetical protein